VDTAGVGWIPLALLSALFAALVAVFGKVGVSKVDPTLATAVRAVIMAGVLVVFALGIGRASHWHELDRRAVLFIVLSGLAGAASWLCYFLALRLGPAPGVAALDRLSVVFVLVFAIGFLGQAFTWKAALGAALLTIGAILLI
jgi:bacterial/archaeal transporter family protein